MDNIIKLVTLAAEFESEKDLKAYCNSQYLALQESKKTIGQLEEEIKHLRIVLNSFVPTELIVSKEQSIVEAQIKLLHDIGLTNSLDIDEVKKLESLVKTLHFIKEKTPRKAPPIAQDRTADLIRAAKIMDKEKEDKDE